MYNWLHVWYTLCMIYPIYYIICVWLTLSPIDTCDVIYLCVGYVGLLRMYDMAESSRSPNLLQQSSTAEATNFSCHELHVKQHIRSKAKHNLLKQSSASAAKNCMSSRYLVMVVVYVWPFRCISRVSRQQHSKHGGALCWKLTESLLQTHRVCVCTTYSDVYHAYHCRIP